MLYEVAPTTVQFYLYFQVPIPIPILFFLCCVYLVIGPIVDEPKMEFLYAGIFVIGGLVLYFPFVHFKLRIPGIGKFLAVATLLTNVYEPRHDKTYLREFPTRHKPACAATEAS